MSHLKAKMHQIQGGHFQDHMKFPEFSMTFPVAWTGEDYRYTA